MDYTVPKNFYEFQYGWYRDIDLHYEAEQLLKVLDSAQKENDIQRYIKENKKWFIPASIFEDYDFGHHEAYISIEQPLGAEYRADYMLFARLENRASRRWHTMQEYIKNRVHELYWKDDINCA